ncbi:MAG: hypothetical protein LEGION0398_MBIBDBAK_01368 [Legionellaceae bacterium]
MLVPKDTNNNLGIILEFKHVKKNEKQKKMAEDALEQIDTNHYQVFLNRYTHIQKVLKVGMAFEDRYVLSFHRFSNLHNEPISELETSSFILKELCDSESSQEEQKKQDKKRKKEESGSSEEDTSDEENSKKKLKENSTSSEKEKTEKTTKVTPTSKGFFSPYVGNKKIIHNSSSEEDKDDEKERPKQSSSRK